MSITHDNPAQQIQQSLSRLRQRLATSQWRGLLIIQASEQHSFTWPTKALVLDGSLNTYRQHLGTNHRLVVLDMRQALHADAIAACVPTLVAQGIAVLVLPQALTHFSRRLVDNLPQHISEHLELTDEAERRRPPIDLGSLPLPQCATGNITQTHAMNVAQADVHAKILAHHEAGYEAPVLLNAPRGRGKSTVLGLIAQSLLEQGIKVTVSAPSQRQLDTLRTSCDKPVPFIAPDLLLCDTKPRIEGVLLFDEVASLPSDMLSKLIAKYPKVIMATTSEGYETCGRGFLLHFQRQLAEQFKHFQLLTLCEPTRFAKDCPVERWLHESLLLTPSEYHYSTPTHHCSLSYTRVHASELSDTALAQSFHLLMDAHYQTSPNDLKLLLDDPSQHLCLQYNNEAAEPCISAVAWLSHEGELPTTLAAQVAAGKRRPPGNLLAQSLSQHMVRPDIAAAKWLRVVRIAVPEAIQQQGLGSALLQYVYETNNELYAAVGASFASHATINRFWRQHDFLPVRLGARKDTTTSKHALMVLKATSCQWQPQVVQWAGCFYHELEAYQAIYQLDGDFICSLEPSFTIDDDAYQAWGRQRISAFIDGQLDLAAIAPTLVTMFPLEVKQNPLLRHGVYNLSLSTDFKREHALTGRKMLQSKVRDICFKLMGAI